MNPRRESKRNRGDAAAAPPPDAAIRIGVSTCLLGEPVRFDGGHKRDAFLVETFGRHVEWVPVCPEVEAGFGTPRESMRLVRAGSEVRLVTTRTAVDLTERMRGYAAKRVAALAQYGLSGYVLKKNSPSCGMERVKVYGARGGSVATGRGVFAEALLAANPHLPVEEEGRLCDPWLRENFVERVFAYHRLRSFFDRRWTIGELVGFHTVHKLQLMAHAPALYTSLGRLVAGAKRVERAALCRRYQADFMKALATLATPKRHVNVLQHMLGYFSERLEGAARGEIVDLIDDYGRSLVPLVVPLTLIRHYARQYGIATLRDQTYLEPHPKELMLRNHV
jgi:uncharacterized protein YbgA (DUF1722 family)/uncharacterized protein YbbK (DUF523 family)